MERLRRLQVERESLESKMEAEKHVMRAQLRDLMEKQQTEVRRMTKQHETQVDQIQQEQLRQLQGLRRALSAAELPRQDAADPTSVQRLAELEGWFSTLNPYVSRMHVCIFKLIINPHAVKHDTIHFIFCSQHLKQVSQTCGPRAICGPGIIICGPVFI